MEIIDRLEIERDMKACLWSYEESQWRFCNPRCIFRSSWPERAWYWCSHGSSWSSSRPPFLKNFRFFAFGAQTLALLGGRTRKSWRSRRAVEFTRVLVLVPMREGHVQLTWVFFLFWFLFLLETGLKRKLILSTKWISPLEASLNYLFAL